MPGQSRCSSHHEQDLSTHRSCPTGSVHCKNSSSPSRLTSSKASHGAPNCRQFSTPHARAVNLDETRLGFGLCKRSLLCGRWLRIGRLFHTQSAGLVHQPQIGDRPLPRAVLSAIRLDQCPIGFTLAIAQTVIGAYEHAPTLATLRSDSFHYTPSPKENFIPSPLPHDLRQNNLEKIAPAADFVQRLGKLD